MLDQNTNNHEMINKATEFIPKANKISIEETNRMNMGKGAFYFVG